MKGCGIDRGAFWRQTEGNSVRLMWELQWTGAGSKEHANTTMETSGKFWLKRHSGVVHDIRILFELGWIDECFEQFHVTALNQDRPYLQRNLELWRHLETDVTQNFTLS
jgi:hypothetical protein